MKNIVFAYLFLFIFNLYSNAQELKSPDGNLKLTFHLDTKGTPIYSLNFKEIKVLEDSKMGFILKSDIFLNADFKISETKFQSEDSIWKPVLGEQKEIRNNYNELKVVLLQEKSKRQVTIYFRLFNDGLGFRYEFPVQENLRHFIIQEETTEFNLTGDHKLFWIPGDYDTNEYSYTTSKISEMQALVYNATHVPLAAQSTIKNLAAQTPLMIKTTNGLYINIHEAALKNYPAMCLNVNDKTFSLSSHLVPDAVGNKGYIQTGSFTPWRTVVVSDDARNILASKLILNLNEPCKYEDVSWIKPVKYIGVWWEYFTGVGSTWAYSDNADVVIGKTDFSKLKPNNTHGANTKHVKEYIDFASSNGFDAVLVEGWNEGWEDNTAFKKERIYSFTKAYPDFDVQELNKYAHQKNVKIIMHHETTSSVAEYERQLKDALDFMTANNYNAVKTGYVGPIIPRGEHHDGQQMVNHYTYVATEAAKHKIMVDSHEAVRPTGLHRTYPNWFAQESARGTEFESMEGIHPDHTTILPFTRLMGGPMDYTPGIFQGDLSVYGSKKNKLSTTLAKQLALYVTMYSPLQMAADLPENYIRFKDAFQFIKDVALDWDETYILEAEPGDYITIARKTKGKQEWFVGGITDENSRTALIDFSFLPAGKSFTAIIYEDGKTADYKTNPQSYSIRKITVNSKSKLKQKLAPSGGVAISIK
ncbi:glycoside hydrolase family 97 protein [Flavobacterium sp. LC2016-01]|uniref:glycoside hydrolase family 97 protein n=1 Tax=Flavobacterium sp. LC2016-01 TaxID=2675876 RepID=UPI0012BA818D|nr:glycoside hydrolase family 97 protein [Flavobacterium sp. LC2016-01]MTH16117.1 glycoside hydrolase family 97 protein [Flavobacterium sp. LC2016-01]